MPEMTLYRKTIDFISDKYPDRSSITVKEAASFLGVNINTIYSAMRTQKHDPLPHKKVAGKTIIPIPAFAHWLTAEKEERRIWW